MTRLQNVMKAGFFPLPEELTSIIASYICPAETEGRILDPCVGAGLALIELAKHLNLDPYGIELNRDRAEAAKINVRNYLIAREMAQNGRSENLEIAERKHIVQGAYGSLRTTHNAYTVNYCNPPYLFADNKDDKRIEYAFLRDTRSLTQVGGVFIWVVPQHMLMHDKAAHYLNTWFDNLTIGRFPDELYEEFKQVVVIGVRRQHPQFADAETVNKTKDLGRLGKQVAQLTIQETPIYTLPKLNKSQFRFREWHVPEQDVYKEIQKRGLVHSTEFQALFAGDVRSEFNPLTPMKVGHLVSIIAAGHLNNQVIEKNGERILLKGSAFKDKVVTESKEKKEGGGSLHRTKSTDKVITHITYLTPSGMTVEVEPYQLADFMAEWIEELSKTVSATYKPRYQFDLNGYAKTLFSLNLSRTLAVYGKPGLLPAQMHTAAAMATHLTDNEAGFIVGEMGTGKTVIGTAVAAILHNQVQKTPHTIVLCPPHLVSKWIREIEVTWPQAKAMALNSITDVDKFFAMPGPVFGVMKETTARSGSGWSHSFTYLGGAMMKPRTPRQNVTFVKHTKSAQMFAKGSAEFDPYFYKKLKYLHNINPLSCPVCGTGVVIGNDDTPAMPSSFKRAKLKCAECESPLYTDDRRRPSATMPIHGFEKYAGREKRFRQGDRLVPSNGNNGSEKYPLASYIFRKYKGRIGLLIADEVHHYKAADSDRGYAFHRLVTASRRTLALTGTIYGGKASTIFDLLYRLSPEVRTAFTDNNKKGKKRLQRMKWVNQYGILQEVQTTSLDEHGKTSGNAKERTVIKELPGASPSMLPWILNMSVFVNMADMGIALPSYEEIPVSLQMTPEMQSRYDRFRKTLTTILREYLLKNNKSLLGSYLQSLLTWPDSPWRNKGVAKPGDPDTLLAFIEGIDMPLGTAPKEAAIIQTILDEKAQGRKSLLLCQQTSTLDITPQWETMLQAKGLKVATLRGVPPDKREKWIAKQVAEGIDVLITHPKKIETGLDLVRRDKTYFMLQK